MQSLSFPSILPSNFQYAYNNLTFGVEPLGLCLGILEPNNLIVLHGSKLCQDLSELLCVYSQLPPVKDKAESSVIFIDGGNHFDPYLISENARLFGLNAEELLKNIWVSRAFTVYQLVSLITEKLVSFIDKKNPRLVVISDIVSLFCNSNIGIFEAKRIFNSIVLFLWKLAKKKNIVFVVTSISSNSDRKQRLELYLFGRADIVIGIDTGEQSAKIMLEKHPFLPSTFKEFYFRSPGNQPLLEDFIGV
jgi:hypothetical protein